MLSRFISWFGKGSGNTKSRHKERAARPASATAHLFDKQQSAAKAPKHKPARNNGGGFDPYDTGKFDRSASWERISKSQR